MGRLLSDDTRAYTWDLASRLTSFKEVSTTTFTSDGFGMRLSRTAGVTTQEYVWNYAFGLPSISVVRQPAGGDLRYYIHLPGGTLLHSIEAADDTRRFYHSDEMGTTLFLTDDLGVITDTYGITPYGMVTAKTGSTDNPFTFLGAYGVMQEGDTGLYYMRARYYDSATNRFVSRDPVKSIAPKQINPYLYAADNPLRYVDASGLRPKDPNIQYRWAHPPPIEFMCEPEPIMSEPDEPETTMSPPIMCEASICCIELWVLEDMEFGQNYQMLKLIRYGSHPGGQVIAILFLMFSNREAPDKLSPREDSEKVEIILTINGIQPKARVPIPPPDPMNPGGYLKFRD